MQILVITMLYFFTTARSECLPYLIPSDKPHYSTFKVSDGLTYFENETDGRIRWTQESFWHHNFYFEADLSEDGILEIRAHLVDSSLGLRSSLSGSDLFKKTIKYFKRRNIKMILATWVEGSDNYRLFHQALGSGTSLEDAAFATWTGQQAKRHGFDRIQDIQIYEKRLSPSGHVLNPKVTVQFHLNSMARLFSNWLFF